MIVGITHVNYFCLHDVIFTGVETWLKWNQTKQTDMSYECSQDASLSLDTQFQVLTFVQNLKFITAASE